MDTGIGVPKGIDIFGLFTTTKFQGLGMGLPIVQQVMTDHGGKITCAAVRRQTVFRAALPSALPDSSH
jgi:nitrogen-specific signal transduction histidine kinase